MVGEGSFVGFPEGVIGFLEELARHNDKAWFEAHRADYEAFYLEPGRAFAADLADRLTEAEVLGPGTRIVGSAFRIFRDTRFSRDKSPYKTHFGVSFGPEGSAPHEDAGFYFHLEPPRMGLGAGMHGFPKLVLEAYRTSVADPAQAATTRALIADAESRGAEMWGKTYKKMPRGYGVAPDDQDLLLYSGLFAWLDLPIPPELHTADLLAYCEERYIGLAPLPLWLARLTPGA